MIVVTTEHVPGHRIKEVLGVVVGHSIRARGLGGDIAAGFKKLVGGSIGAYKRILGEIREEAMRHMVDEALKLGADAIVNVRFMTTDMMQAAAELYVYGTAVKLEKE